MRRVAAIVSTALAVVAVPAAALAGGWAITTFQELPTEFIPGESHEVEYTILAHGKRPENVEATAVVLRSGREMLRFIGEPTGETGRYRAVIEVPVSGAWVWEVDQDWYGPQKLGALPVPSAAIGSNDQGLLRLLLPMATALAAALLLVEVMRLRRDGSQSRPSEQPA